MVSESNEKSTAPLIEQDYDSVARLTIAAFTTMISAVLAATYLLARVGFDNPILPVLQVLSCSLYILLAPSVFHSLVRLFRWEVQKSWLTSDSSIILGALLSLVVAGMITPRLGFSLYPVFGPLSTIFFGIFVAECRSQKLLRSLRRIFILGVFFGFFMATAVWGKTSYDVTGLNPLFNERLLLGQTFEDEMFHISIANMISTYQTPSTGLNGHPYLAYHYGSHWIFAQLSVLENIDVLTFYQLGFPTIFIPLFFYGLLNFSVTFSAWIKVASGRLFSSDNWYWFALVVSIISVLPYKTQFDRGVVWELFISSESYSVALTFMFLLLSLILCVVKERHIVYRISSPTQAIAVIAIIPVLIALTGFMKVSIMVLFMCAYGYLFLKGRFFRSSVLVIGFIVACVLSLITYRLVSYVGDAYAPFLFMAYIQRYVGFLNAPVWLIISLFWTLVYAVIRIYDLGIRKISTLKRAFFQNQILDLELLTIISVAGMLPGLVFDIPGRSAEFFFGVQNFVSIGMMLILLSRILTKQRILNGFSLRRLRQISLYQAGYVAVIGMICLGILTNYTKIFIGFVNVNRTVRIAFSDGQTTLTSLIQQGNIRAIANFFIDNEKYVRANARYSLLSTLQGFSKLTPEDKSKALVYIAKDETEYWTWLPCNKSPFIVPMITGMAMVDGLPITDCKVAAYGYDTYDLSPSQYPEGSSGNPDIQAICTNAKRLGWNQVVKIDISDTNTVNVERVSCE